MAFLGKAKKQDLVLLAEELGQKVSDKMTNIELRNIIIGSKDYEEKFVRAQLSVILEERLERESEEKIQQQREFELEKMRLEIERSRFDSENLSPLKTNVSDLIKIIPNFDIRDGDIVLFLTLFERQAKHIGVEKTNWVSALLARMPPDITQLIARESEDKFDNYDYIKGVLLKRFKMSPETFRQKFMKHQRIPARSWRDFVFEITSYFEEWLDGMEVRDFKSLKDLIITDQLKKRVPGEIREHFVDEWTKFYEPSVLADKLDGYESVRSSVKKTSQPEMSLSNTSDSRSNIKKEHAIIKNDIQSQRYKLPFKQEPKQPTFKPTCYSCGRVGHTSRVCHAKNHKETSPTRQINAVETNERFQEQSSAILTAKVAIPVYSPAKEDEKIDELQFVHIKCGNEILKAVIDTGARYPCAVRKRVQFIHNPANSYVSSRAVEGITADDPKSISSQEMTRETYPSEIYIQSVSKANEEEQLPEGRETRSTFIKMQREDDTLKKLWSLAEKQKNSVKIHNGILVHSEYICGENIDQVVLPQCKREEVLKMAHDVPLGGHLGEQKTRQRIKYSFYWPTIKQDVKRFCESCKICQLRKPITYRDRVSIQPLVRPEIPFEVWSVDCIGPLEPPSRRNHHFIICAVDLCTRWAEAIPVKEISAKTTCNVLLKIFTQTGFPKMICSDQ
ncbi:retrovirus-related Pol polyprotein from transposon opus [Trichonephila clavipes]|nr:retrovirus-related Pol polyprotein from transposon opus [Trichonephila clavipes]